MDPSSIEKVKVGLALRVFSDKTVAALTQDGCEETAAFVYHVLKMWKILNNKSTTAYVNLNDEDRRPIQSPTDQQLQYLSDFSESVRGMKAKRKNRRQTLSWETSHSLTQTLDGLVSLCKSLLTSDPAPEFILLGAFQSDCIEGEFGIYRQAFGGLYHITFVSISDV